MKATDRCTYSFYLSSKNVKCGHTFLFYHQSDFVYNVQRSHHSSSVSVGTWEWEYQLETTEQEFNKSNMTDRYEKAIEALNGLQTNYAVLDKVIKERQRNVHLNIPITKKFLEASGMSLQDLDKMKIIHVSGTKGKG